MATAFVEQMRSEQVSKIQHQSICGRCGGLLVSDFCMDLLSDSGELNFAPQRCVQCGDLVDPVILQNRRLQQESTTSVL